MLGSLRNFVRRKWRTIVIAFSVFALLIVALILYEPSTPDGIYFDPYLDCGHGCWVFKDGKVFTKCEDHVLHNAGTYLKLGNQWVSGANSTNQTIIRPSLFGIKLIGPSWKGDRVFFLRDCFSWVIDCRDWIQLHM